MQIEQYEAQASRPGWRYLQSVSRRFWSCRIKATSTWMSGLSSKAVFAALSDATAFSSNIALLIFVSKLHIYSTDCATMPKVHLGGHAPTHTLQHIHTSMHASTHAHSHMHTHLYTQARMHAHISLLCRTPKEYEAGHAPHAVNVPVMIRGAEVGMTQQSSPLSVFKTVAPSSRHAAMLAGCRIPSLYLCSMGFMSKSTFSSCGRKAWHGTHHMHSPVSQGCVASTAHRQKHFIA